MNIALTPLKKFLGYYVMINMDGLSQSDNILWFSNVSLCIGSLLRGC